MNGIDKKMMEYRNRLDKTLYKVDNLTPAQQDKLKVYGTSAENLLNNNEYDTFVNWYLFSLYDELNNISGHTDEDNAKRVAITHQIAGMTGFADYLKKLIRRKNEVVSRQSAPLE